MSLLSHEILFCYVKIFWAFLSTQVLLYHVKEDYINPITYQLRHLSDHMLQSAPVAIWHTDLCANLHLCYSW